jgi:hypothetical protein
MSEQQAFQRSGTDAQRRPPMPAGARGHNVQAATVPFSHALQGAKVSQPAAAETRNVPAALGESAPALRAAMISSADHRDGWPNRTCNRHARTRAADVRRLGVLGSGSG